MPKNMSLAEWGNRSKALSDAFDAIPGCQEWFLSAGARRRNAIAMAVSSKIPKEKAGLKDKFEQAYYDLLWKEAQLHQEAYGIWPTFEVEEIEYDALGDGQE